MSLHPEVEVRGDDLGRELRREDRRDLILQAIGLAARGSAETGKTGHLTARARSSGLLLPVEVHDPSLPLLVRTRLRGHDGVERPAPWTFGVRSGGWVRCPSGGGGGAERRLAARSIQRGRMFRRMLSKPVELAGYLLQLHLEAHLRALQPPKLLQEQLRFAAWRGQAGSGVHHAD